MQVNDQFLLTKILASIGPASYDIERLVHMVEAGVRVVRINFSHGDFDDFAKALSLAREAARRTRIDIGVLGDLCGPKIRVGEVLDDVFEVEQGDLIEITRKDVISQKYKDTGISVVSTSFPDMIDEAETGDRLLIDDGFVRTLVVDKPYAHDDRGHRLCCRVTHGGKISTRKGINLPDTHLSTPSLTDYDRECAEWALENDLDFLALSFVRHADDLNDLRDHLRSLKPKGVLPPIVAKIEKPQAVDHIDAICDRADGIMVARGDLGVEMDLAEVPIIQKRIIETAHDYGKPVIVATQMLQSMIVESTPTRAEVSDVANAILDGADAVMLSGETAVGKHPVQAVTYMGRTASRTEAHANDRRDASGHAPRTLRESRYRTAALAHGVSILVDDLAPKFVVSWSELGGGARYLSQNRLPVPIVAISSNHAALRHMSLLYGVTPIFMSRPRDSQEFLMMVDDLLLDRQWAKHGDAIVVVKGEPIGRPGVTNQIVVHYVGDVTNVGWHAKTEFDDM